MNRQILTFFARLYLLAAWFAVYFGLAIALAWMLSMSVMVFFGKDVMLDPAILGSPLHMPIFGAVQNFGILSLVLFVYTLILTAVTAISGNFAGSKLDALDRALMLQGREEVWNSWLENSIEHAELPGREQLEVESELYSVLESWAVRSFPDTNHMGNYLGGCFAFFVFGGISGRSAASKRREYVEDLMDKYREARDIHRN